MYRGFPSAALKTLCCPKCRGTLVSETSGPFILDGSVRCDECQFQYPIAAGILHLLDESALDHVSRENLKTFDLNSAAETFEHETDVASLRDLLPTLEALGPLADKFVIEFGCGNGRFTVRIAPTAALLVAVDYSIEALRKVMSRTKASWNIALVRADCSNPVARAGSFDRVLCTLTSNLPGKEEREHLFRQAALAAWPDGRFVCSAHHYGLRARFKNTPRAGYYDQDKIFRYLSGRRELAQEGESAFSVVHCRPISVILPLERRLGVANIGMSRFLERLPLINQMGELLLLTADKPRSPAHAQERN